MEYNEYHKTIVSKIQQLKTDNNEGWSFINNKVQKNTKEIVRKVRQFYDNAYVEQGQALQLDDKFFFPLTKTVVDSMTANLDFDIKDISITAKNPEKASVVGMLKEFFIVKAQQTNFGRLLNKANKNMVLDGTVVTRTEEVDGKPVTYLVNLLNFWTDFNSDNPTWFLERILKNKDSLPKEWNVEDRQVGATILEEAGYDQRKQVETYIFEGKCPMSYITYNEADTKEVYVRIIMVGRDMKIVDTNYLGDTEDKLSYDFAQYEPNQSRFISCGLGEAVMNWQYWFNNLYNSRQKLTDIHATGIYQIRKGSGITPDMVASISSGGGIPVSQIGTDIAPLAISGSNNDNFISEQRGLDAVQRLTGVTPIAQGLQDKSGATLGEVQLTAGFSNTRFKFQRQDFAFMLNSIVAKHLDIIVKNMDIEEVIQVSDENLRSTLAQIASDDEVLALMKRNLRTVGLRGIQPTVEAAEAGNFWSKHFQSNGFRLLKASLKDLDYIVNIQVSNEMKDTASLTRNLIQLIQLAPTVPSMDVEKITEKLFSELGISVVSFKGKPAPVPTEGLQPFGLETRGVGTINTR